MHKLVLILTLFSLSLLINACSGTTTLEATSQQQPLANQPSWINNPQQEGFQVAVGQASIANKHYQRIAYLQAQTELAKQVSIYIDTQCQFLQRLSSKLETTTCQASQTTQQLMHQSKILDQWEDAENLYILLGIANETIN